MKAEQLMEAVITAAQEGRNLTVRSVMQNYAVNKGDRILLVPVLYRKEFILLYYGEHGQDDEDFNAPNGERLEYGGFIFIRNKKWYDPRRYILSCLTGDEYEGIISTLDSSSIVNECEKAFKEHLTEFFLQSDDTKKPCNLSGYSIEAVLSLIVSNTDVSEMTLHDLTKSLNFKILGEINGFRYLEDADGYMAELVAKSYDVNKMTLRRAQVILNKMKKDYRNLKRNIQHPIWKKAELVRVIPNPKSKVNVTFKIGSCLITEKMKAEPLVRGINMKLTERDLPPNVRAVLKASRNAPEDDFLTLDVIETISHRKGIIYSKQEFMKKMEEGQRILAEKEESGVDGM